MGSRIQIRMPDDDPTGPAIREVPLPPPPREVRFKTKVKVGAAIITTLVLGGGATLLLLAVAHGHALERLRDGGVLVNGTVDDRKISRSTRSRTCTIYYHFEHDGQVVHDSESVSAGHFDLLAIGARVPVTYERADPSNHQLFAVGERKVALFWRATSIAGTAAAAVALVIGACFAAVYSRRLALLRDGPLIAATIVKIGPVVARHRRRKIEFAFAASTGDSVTRRHWIPSDVIVPGQEGQSVGYLVAPGDGRKGAPLLVVLASCELV